MEINPLKYMEKPVRNTEKQQAAGSRTEELAELEKASVEAIGKNFYKAAMQATGEALEQLGERQAEEKKSGDSSAQKAEEDKRSDEVVLSKETVLHGKREETEQIIKLLEAALEKEWTILEQWRINPAVSFEKELMQLKELYQHIRQMILHEFPSDLQKMQIDQLNRMIFDILQKEGEARYPQLLTFLKQFGPDRGDEIVQLMILKEVAGKSVRLYKKCESMAQETGNSGFFTTPNARDVKEEQMRMHEGVLYSRGEKKEVHVAKAFQKQLWNQERSGIPFFTDMDAGSVRGKSYTAADIEKTEKFLNYINYGGDLSQKVDILQGREELAGFLLAENVLKAQVYQEYAGVGKSLGQDIRTAFQKMTDYCLRGQYGKTGGTVPNEKAGQPPDMKRVRHVYYQVLSLFQKAKAPKKAMEKGLEFAAGEYYAGQEEKGKTGKRERQSAASFFRGIVEEENPQKEWEKGKRALERDWNDFLVSIGNENNAFLQWTYSSFSPWGMLEEPKTPGKGGVFGPGVFVFLAAVLIILIMIVQRIF